MIRLTEDARASFALLLLDAEQPRNKDSVLAAQDDEIAMLRNFLN